MNGSTVACIAFDQLCRFKEQDYFSNGKITVAVDKGMFPTLPYFHRHDYYELAYIASGDGIEIINAGTYIVKKGDVIFFRLTDVHSYNSLCDLHVVNVCFRPDILPEINLLDKDPNAAIVLHLSEDEQIEFETLLSMLQRECTSGADGARREYTDEASQNYLNLLMIFLRRIGYMRRTVGEETTEKRWQLLLQYIAREYRTVTLDAAAQEMYLSKNYFCRMFKKTFGVTFLDYLDSIRLRMAKELLVTGGAPIADVWSAVGFTQPKRFHALFRADTGMTPMQYRKAVHTVQGRERDSSLSQELRYQI